MMTVIPVFSAVIPEIPAIILEIPAIIVSNIEYFEYFGNYYILQFQ